MVGFASHEVGKSLCHPVMRTPHATMHHSDGIQMTDEKHAHFETEDRHLGGIQVIARMSKIMRALSAHPHGLSLAEIAMEVGLPRSTVQRIVTAAVAENILESVGAKGGFRIGPALGQMLYQTQADIIPIVRPQLERLSQELEETVCLTRLSGRQVTISDMVVGEQVLRIVPPLGGVAPCHLSADGKAILARMSHDKVVEWFAGGLSPEGRHPKTPSQLLSELEEIRRSGFAYDYEGYTEGLCAVAMSLGTYRGTYAVSVLAPAPRMHLKVEPFKKALKDRRDALERLLGTGSD